MRRILSIDGGGIKGVFAASFLAEIEQQIEGRIADYFDLIAGTSTGGIIAIALALGHTAREITELYQVDGPKIFAGNGPFRKLMWLAAPKYEPTALRRALQARFADRTLGCAQTRLLVPAQELDTGRIYIFKTPHHHDLRTDWRTRAVDAALATSAAPTYFPATSFAGKPRWIDGGLWANNPLSLACVEAIGTRLQWPANEVAALSISCTSEPVVRHIPRQALAGILGWAYPGIGVSFSGQSQASTGIAKNLLGRERVMRIDPPARCDLDEISAIERLVGLGHSEARHHSQAVIDRFFGHPAEPFTPCHLE